MSAHRGSPSSSLTAALLAEADHIRKHPGAASIAAAPANPDTSLPSAPSSNGEVFEPSSQPTVVGSPWGMGRGGGIFMRSAPSHGSLRRSLDLIREQDPPQARHYPLMLLLDTKKPKKPYERALTSWVPLNRVATLQMHASMKYRRTWRPAAHGHRRGPASACPLRSRCCSTLPAQPMPSHR